MKDICIDSKAVPYYKSALAEAQSVSKFLTNARLLHSRLVELAAEQGGQKLRAFALSVITRWGTQFYVVDALLENRQFIEQLAERYRGRFRRTKTAHVGSGSAVLSLIEDPQF